VGDSETGAGCGAGGMLIMSNVNKILGLVVRQLNYVRFAIICAKAMKIILIYPLVLILTVSFSLGR